MSNSVLSVTEVEAKYDRPLWAAQLMRCYYVAGSDHCPYYWVDITGLIIKRVTSKRKLNPFIYLDDLIPERAYIPAKFKLPFFEELRQANMLEE